MGRVERQDDKVLTILESLQKEYVSPDQLTYTEIATKYGIGYGSISKKVNKAKVAQSQSRFGGRLLKSISVNDAEMLFRKKMR